MRHKPLPPPPDDLAAVRAAQGAVPLVPGSESDCCARIQGRLDLPSRDVAATWLAFLRALGLADAGPSGYTRVRRDPDEAALAEAFLTNVYGAQEILEVLRSAGEPLEAAAVAARTEDLGTPWERRKHGSDWKSVWQRRTADLLDWLVRLGRVDRVDGGYRPIESD